MNPHEKHYDLLALEAQKAREFRKIHDALLLSILFISIFSIASWVFLFFKWVQITGGKS